MGMINTGGQVLSFFIFIFIFIYFSHSTPLSFPYPTPLLTLPPFNFFSPSSIFSLQKQRSERTKWPHVITSTTSLVIFNVSLAEYNRKLFEDHSTYSLNESLNLLSSILSPTVYSLASVPFVVYFTMLDVFKRKIELGVNIESYVEVKEPIRLEGVQTGEKEEEGEEGGMWYQWEVFFFFF